MATVAGRGERARKETPKKSVTATNTPSEEEIRLLAYHLYERRCESGAAGDASEDWIQAERLLLSSTRSSTNSN